MTKDSFHTLNACAYPAHLPKMATATAGAYSDSDEKVTPRTVHSSLARQ